MIAADTLLPSGRRLASAAAAYALMKLSPDSWPADD